jgi:hypothetical protein
MVMAPLLLLPAMVMAPLLLLPAIVLAPLLLLLPAMMMAPMLLLLLRILYKASHHDTRLVGSLGLLVLSDVSTEMYQ